MSKRTPMRATTRAPSTSHTMRVIKNAISDQVKKETNKVKIAEREKCKKAKAKMRKKK